MYTCIQWRTTVFSIWVTPYGVVCIQLIDLRLRIRILLVAVYSPEHLGQPSHNPAKLYSFSQIWSCAWHHFLHSVVIWRRSWRGWEMATSDDVFLGSPLLIGAVETTSFVTLACDEQKPKLATKSKYNPHYLQCIIALNENLSPLSCYSSCRFELPNIRSPAHSGHPSHSFGHVHFHDHFSSWS